MPVALGSGWKLTHLSDRVIELTKDDVAYRRYTGRDGYVRYRAEPGASRSAMIAEAMAMAQRNDAMLADRIARQIVPRRLGEWRQRQQQLARVFRTPEEPELIGAQSA